MCSIFSSGKNEERAWSHLELVKRGWPNRIYVGLTGLLASALLVDAIYTGVGTNKPNTTNTTID